MANQGKEGMSNELIQWIENNNLHDMKSQILKSTMPLQVFAKVSGESLQNIQLRQIILFLFINITYDIIH